jgi:hypothetical protein
VDGTAKVKRALLEIFYQLEKQQRDDGISLLRPNKVTALREKDQAISVTASMVDPSEDTFL